MKPKPMETRMLSSLLLSPSESYVSSIKAFSHLWIVLLSISWKEEIPIKASKQAITLVGMLMLKRLRFTIKFISAIIRHISFIDTFIKSWMNKFKTIENSKL